MKDVIVWAVSLFALFVSLPINAYDLKSGGIYYNIDGDNASVTRGPDGYHYRGDIVIPSQVETYRVTSIEKDAFSYCKQLTSITIPNSVTTIGKYAFKSCESITSLTIPNSVISIGDYAFDLCTSLTSVTLGNSITSIGERAFGFCSGLTSITIPNSVTTIGGYAFWCCRSLYSITIPSSVTMIGHGALHGTAWYDNQPEGIIYAGKVAYDYKWMVQPKNMSMALKDGTVGITDDAFYSFTGLTSVTIPNSVICIGRGAFRECRNLTSIISEIETPFAINDDVFDCDRDRKYLYETATLFVPIGTKEKYQSTDGWKQFKNIVEGNASNINAEIIEEIMDCPIYDLNGRLLDQPQKGINIIGGKKLIIR